jgi:uncharacterized protein YprB with RNaseH-like and TPR domain
MITNTFSIFPGIGPRLEHYLWRLGVLTWDDFLRREHIPGFSPSRKPVLDEYVADALAQWESRNYHYFGRLLGTNGMWRLWETLSDDALFLDIETDGRKVAEGELTVVGFYSHGEYRAYINGQNLDCDSLQQEFDDARLLVTFSGNTFDIPYLKAYYPELAIDLPHIDLCPTGHKVGLKGGLKKVEKQIGISREDGIEGMGGYEAVLLWRAHQNNMAGALDTLVKYNREDTVNLLPLTRIICDKLKENSGIAGFLAARPALAATLL